MRHLVDKIENNAGQLARYKEFELQDADTVLISYGSAARSALHVVRNRRARGEKLGLLELQTLWPFPAALVRDHCARARSVVVVEMNTGQIMREVKAAVKNPENVFLANRIDGTLITPTDIRNILRLIQGRGV
jgi:2-oxoglutarate ferredoxin oxidoreductase subunit alpha